LELIAFGFGRQSLLALAFDLVGAALFALAGCLDTTTNLRRKPADRRAAMNRLSGDVKGPKYSPG